MEEVFSVTSFNKFVKNILDDVDELHEIFIEGELSNITYYKSGHLYFSLKDEKAQIKCVAFNYKMKNIDENLKEGDKVKILGDASYYETRGDFQILARNIQKQDEIGSLFRQLEKDKKFLEENGYFDKKHKKALPFYAKNIGVVTAATGAAIHDIIKTLKKRNDTVNLYLYPSKVQGIGAEAEIIKGIETLNQIEEIDFIICGRGGGSIEDLWAFNSKEVALAFFNSKKPIISAVGHESDVLLSDYTADVRAATPTQAIELSILEKDNLVYTLEEYKKYIKNLLKNNFENKKNQLENLKRAYVLQNFTNLTENFSNELIRFEDKLNNLIFNKLEKSKFIFEQYLEKIEALNPIKVLSRGYSVTNCKNKTIKSIKNVNIGDEVRTILNDGELISIVKEKFYAKK